MQSSILGDERQCSMDLLAPSGPTRTAPSYRGDIDRQARLRSVVEINYKMS